VALAAITLALAWSALPAAPVVSTDERPTAGDAPSGDYALHARIADKVAAGGDYYAAALAEHRAQDYPTRLFLAVRLPTLAVVNAWLGRGPTGLVVVALLLANVLAWPRALAGAASSPERLVATVLTFLAGFAAFEPRGALSHELVAGLLLSLSLALYRPGFATPALLALAAALAVRELALPFALAWLAFALLDKRWHEASALAAILALFAGGLALHAFTIEQLLIPADRASQGWGGMEGPRLALDGIARFTALLLLPAWLAGPLVLLPLVGWIGLGGRLGPFAALWFGGFALLVAILAGPDNLDWMLMVLPAWFAGLAFAPRALADLLGAVTHRSPPAPA